ncbi:MAG: FHA domain-containing protein [Archangiaceae bacterium]|nr:FHA domain-containing protein [Archangiaceae bacterium]
MAFRLFIARGQSQGQQFIAMQPMVFIGRDASCDVVLSDPGVSSRHVRITERDGHYFAVDLQSSNGTLLNGAPLAVEREIVSGDSLGVGTAVVQLSLLEVPDATLRRRLKPTGVEVAGKRDTGEQLQARPRKDDDETTAPAGRPLPREAPIDRQRYEVDTDKTSPVAPAIRSPTFKVDLPPPRPSLPPPPRPSLANRAAGAATVAAPALEQVSATAGTARELLPVSERDRQPGEPDRATPLEGTPALPLPWAEPPEVGAGAEPAATLDPSALDEPETPRLPAGVSSSSEDAETASVLVPALQVLKRTPEAANADTQLRAVTQVDEPTDARAPAQPQLEGAALESAADRARKKRQARSTLGGQLGWYWGQLSLRTRVVVGSVLGVAVGGLAFALFEVFAPEQHGELPPEPSTLGARPIPYSFGFGPEVDYEHVDFKELKFEVKSPTAAAVMLHYRAHDIGADEVAITVNGTALGYVPADVGLPERELETLVSQFVIARGGTNLLVFDDVLNPPGKERWSISELSIELIPVPEVTADQALAAAREAHARAELLEKQRASGDDTLFNLWRTCRHGWISLLPLKEEKRGWLWGELKRHADAARGELDTLCGTLMLDAKKQIELKNPEGAREILEGVPRFFPTREHPCQAIADEKLKEYDL